MARVKLALKPENNVFYVVYRFYHKGNSRMIYSGFRVPDRKYFVVTDQKKGLGVIKKNDLVENIERANSLLAFNMDKYNARLTQISKSYYLEQMEISELMDRMTTEVIETLTDAFMDKYNRLNNAGKYTTAKNYFRTANFWRKFFKRQTVYFSDITHQELKRAELWHIGKGKSINGFWSVGKDTKAIFNEFINNGLLDESLNPFKHYKLKYEKTKKRAIPMDLLKLIFNYNGDGALRFAADVFMVSFFFAGMNISDICFLKVQDVADKLYYKRRKTGDWFTWDIAPQIKPILKRWKANKAKKRYLLDVIDERRTSKENAYQIELFTARVNDGLDGICKKTNIFEKVTTYTARHSWASLARDKGVDISIISNALGHESIKTTQIYLSQLNTADVNKANKLISDLF